MLNKVQFSQLIETLKQQIALMSQSTQPQWDFLELTLNRFQLTEKQLKTAYQQLFNIVPQKVRESWQQEQFESIVKEARLYLASSHLQEAMHHYQMYCLKKLSIAQLPDQLIFNEYAQLLLDHRNLREIEQWVKRYEGFAKSQGYGLYEKMPLILLIKGRLWVEQAQIKKAQAIVDIFKSQIDHQNENIRFAYQILVLKIAKYRFNAVVKKEIFDVLIDQDPRVDAFIEHITCLEENGASPAEQYLYFQKKFEDLNFGEQPNISLYYLRILEKLNSFNYCFQLCEYLYQKYPSHFEIKKYWQMLNIIKEDFETTSLYVEEEISWLRYLDLQLEPDHLRFHELFDAEKYYYFVLYLVKTNQKDLLQTLLSFGDLLKSGGAINYFFLLKVEYYLSDWLEDPQRYHLALKSFKKEAFQLEGQDSFWILYLIETFIFFVKPKNVVGLALDHPNHFAIQMLYSRYLIANQKFDQINWFEENLEKALLDNQQLSTPIPRDLIDYQFDIFLEKNDLKSAYAFYINRVKTLTSDTPFEEYYFVQAAYPLALLQYIIEETELPHGIDHIAALEDIYSTLGVHYRIRAKVEIKLAFLYALINDKDKALHYLNRAQKRNLSHILETQILIWACEVCDIVDALDLLPYWTKDLISREGYQSEIDYFAAQSLWHVGDLENAKIAAQRSSKSNKDYLPAYWILGKHQLIVEKNPELSSHYFKLYQKYKYIGEKRKAELISYQMNIAIQLDQKSSIDKAMKQLIKLKQQSPLEIYHLRADLLYDHQKYQDVIDFLTTKDKRLTTESYLYIAKSYEALKDESQAVFYFEKAIEQSKDIEEECIARYAYAIYLQRKKEQISAEAQLLKIYHIFETHQHPSALLELALEYLKTLVNMGNRHLADTQYQLLMENANDQNREEDLLRVIDSWMQVLIETDQYEDILEIAQKYLARFHAYQELSLRLKGYLGCYYFFEKEFALAEEQLEQLYIEGFYAFNDYYLKTLRVLDKKAFAYSVLNEMIALLPYEYEPRKWMVEYLIEDELLSEIDTHLDVIRKYHPQRLNMEDWNEKLAQIRKYQ